MIIHQLKGYIQCIYLVEYPHGLMLLDGCCRSDVKVVKAFIETELNRPFNDLKVVLVTHMHPDHAGGAHLFRRLTGCQVVSADKNNHWYRGFNGILMHWIDVVLSIYVGRRLKKGTRNVLYSRKLKPDVKLKDGDDVPGFDEWQVLETPGHTDRDLSILHKDKNMVYVADLIIKLRTKFIVPFPVFHPNKYRTSLQRIKQMKPKLVLLAHGGQIKMAHEDFDHMIAHAPKIPRTPLRATIKKFKKITQRH